MKKNIFILIISCLVQLVFASEQDYDSYQNLQRVINNRDNLQEVHDLSNSIRQQLTTPNYSYPNNLARAKAVLAALWVEKYSNYPLKLNSKRQIKFLKNTISEGLKDVGVYYARTHRRRYAPIDFRRENFLSVLRKLVQLQENIKDIASGNTADCIPASAITAFSNTVSKFFYILGNLSCATSSLCCIVPMMVSPLVPFSSCCVVESAATAAAVCTCTCQCSTSCFYCLGKSTNLFCRPKVVNGTLKFIDLFNKVGLKRRDEKIADQMLYSLLSNEMKNFGLLIRESLLELTRLEVAPNRNLEQ